MNKKVLRTVIYLLWGFLIAFALLKTVWAEKFAIAVSAPNIIKVGSFIDNRIWLKQIVHCIWTLVTYQFYFCACCHKWHLTWKQYFILIPIIIGLTYLNWYFPAVMVCVNCVFMFAVPLFLKAKYVDVVIIFTAHSIGQLVISYIRSQPMFLADVNVITQFICCIDAYVWLIIYYLYSNLYKESIIMGSAMPPFWGKFDKQIEKKIAKLDIQIAEEKDEKKKAKLIDKKAEYEEMLSDDKD